MLGINLPRLLVTHSLVARTSATKADAAEGFRLVGAFAEQPRSAWRRSRPESDLSSRSAHQPAPVQTVAMAVNITLKPQFPVDRATDSMGRTWAGWDPDISDQVIWDHNRGRHTFGPRVDDERYATMSFEGVIRVVAEITGRREETNPKGGTRKKWSLEGRVLPREDPVRRAFTGLIAPTSRNSIEYFPDPNGPPAVNDTFLLTNNPIKFEIHPDLLVEWIDATATGHKVEGQWSTGVTIKKIQRGHRAFLLRQGVADRGVFASGRFISQVYKAGHWDEPTREANYADVDWDTVLDPEDALPIETLFAELPQGQWEPQASGSQINPAVVGRLEQLWRTHVAAVRRTPAPLPRTPNTRVGTGQGRRLDAKLRKQIEDLAQRRLMGVYKADGWTVVDLRVGNPFDAKATKGDDVLYLEAKGTVTAGERVIVTRGEVNWARSHPGECVIGIVSGFTVKRDGTVNPNSGTLREYLWEPQDKDLDPINYDFYPPGDGEI